jgi:uncharacterized membrane protein YqgA involved in biofilm formation
MKDFALFGALVNAALVVAGSLIGLLVRLITGSGGKKEPSERGKRVSDAIFAAIGLCVILIGIDGAIKGAVNGQISDALDNAGLVAQNLFTERTLVIIISMVLGVAIGEIVNLDRGMNALGDKIQALIRGKGGDVARGFVSASLLFCVGSMAIVGSLNSGIMGDHSIQITKGVIDFVAAIIFASAMGVGVMFSAVLVLVYQGTISLLAFYVAPYLNGDVITCMTTVGSLVIIALGLNLLGISKFKVMNFVPAIFLPIALVPVENWITSLF